MDYPTKIAAIVGLLVALSAASERMVEIVKGLWGWLDKEKEDERQERWRRALLQALAVGAGIGTTLLARPAIPPTLLPDSSSILPLLALGFLASGGSGLWNSILTYLLKLKDIREELAKFTATKAEIAHQIIAGEMVGGPDGKVVGRDGKVVPNEEVAVGKAEAIAKLDSVVVYLVARA